jgi:hypothetical protein
MQIQPWLPGFTRVDLDYTGINAPEVGRPYDETSHPKICLHTTEGSSLAGAERAFALYPPHVGVDFERLHRRQYLPLDRCSFSLRGSESDDEFVVQIEIVGFSTQTPNWSIQKLDWLGREVIAPICRATGCPLTIVPAGFHGLGEGIILASTSSPIRFKSEGALRAFSGIMGHQHAPAPDHHWDPGKLNVHRIVQAAAAVLEPKPEPPTTPLEEILMDQAINFYVRNGAGAVLFVMRNLHNKDFPVSCMGVTGPWTAPSGAVTWQVADDDFGFFSRYRIDNKPVPVPAV